MVITRLRAPNPSPMTLEGTNGYVIGVGPGAVVAIDPGIDDKRHIESFVAAADSLHARFAAIFVTHGHPDHYPGAIALQRVTKAPICAHRTALFPFDRALDDMMRLPFEEASFTALHAPGHARDHVVFWLEEARALFTGDVIIGTGTVVIAPPDGDMRLYQASLERLLHQYGHAQTIYGGHGPTINNPREKMSEYIAHRKRREAQIIAALGRKAATIPALVREIYADVNPVVWPAAARQILAYLIALEREGRVASSALDEAPDEADRALMNPDLRALASGDELPLLRAELGFDGGREPIVRYFATGAC